MVAEWRFEPGDITRRKEVMEEYGGSYLGGIEPSRRSPNVFIYTDPDQGRKHGYNFDGWAGEHGPVFNYTGDGQVGDQDPERGGNAAILNHREDGRTLRLFEVAGKNRGGGKPQRYVGEFFLDSNDPWRFEYAPGSDGRLRKVVVFRLIAVDERASRAVSEAGVHPVSTDQLAGAFALEPLALREAVMSWLSARSHDGAEPVNIRMLRDFRPGGLDVSIVGVVGQAWAPPNFGGALSFLSPPSAEVPDLWDGSGLLALPVENSDSAREALRSALKARLPMIWFQGIGGSDFLPIYPVYITTENEQGFSLATDEMYGLAERASDSGAEEALRRYVWVEAKRRLHQPVFRAMVLRAYRNRCSVCGLAHVSLLDAAHIVGDAHDLGVAAVRNGMALCKLHHSAFDSHIMGITPDLTIEISARVLAEVDGPTLLHALQGRHGQRLMVIPELEPEMPDPALLEIHYENFRRAVS